MAEFEEMLRQMRMNEEDTRAKKENLENSLKEQRRLDEEQEKQDLPKRVFSAHTFFRKDIEPILKTLETAYLSGKTDLETHSSVFTEDFDKWMASWSSPGASFIPWPSYSFRWQCEKGKGTHHMGFKLESSRLNIMIAEDTFMSGSQEQRENIRDIDYVKDYIKNSLVHCDNGDWSDQFKGIIIKLLKYPETTHCNYGPEHDINDIGGLG